MSPEALLNSIEDAKRSSDLNSILLPLRERIEVRTGLRVMRGLMLWQEPVYAGCHLRVKTQAGLAVVPDFG